jgi:hypothetical protein
MNISNKQLRRAGRGWSSAWGFGGELTTPHLKKSVYYKMFTTALVLDRLFCMTKHQKMNVRFGTWNVRSLYMTGSLKTEARELGKC